jgi:glucokinase
MGNTSSTEQQVIALDIGGSSIKSAVVSSLGRLAGPVATTPIDSRADAEIIFATFAAAIRQHLPEMTSTRFLGVAIGCPGPFDYQAGVSYIRGVAKYESIYGSNVAICVRAQLAMPTLPIVFRNDAEAAIVGEARHGAGRAYRRLIGVTLGTGIGSAFVVDGVRVTDGPGVTRDGWLYHVPYHSVQADDIFSTRGLLARLRAIDSRHDSVLAFAEAAREGKAQLRQGFSGFGDNLGEFLHPFVLAFDAEAVLVLGGIAGAFDLFGASLARRLPSPVLTGQLGIRAPLLGAADLLFNP